MNFIDAIGWGEGLFDWAWRTSLHASVLIGLVWIVQLLLGMKLNSRWRYAFGFLVLLRLMVPAVPESTFSIFNLGSRYTLPAPSPVVEPADYTGPIEVMALPVETTLLVPVPDRMDDVKTERSEFGMVPLTGRSPASFGWTISLSDTLKWIWLAGAVGILLRIGLQQHTLSRWIKGRKAHVLPRLLDMLEDGKVTMGVRNRVRLLVVPDLGTAAVFGFRRPTILLPAGLVETMSERELRFILLHELAHIRRGDSLLNWTMILVQSLHWFNPLVWIFMKRFRADRELICDAMVLKHLSGGEQYSYGETLIKLLGLFSRNKIQAGLVPVIDRKQDIKRRIAMISSKSVMSRFAQAGVVLLLAGLFCVTFTRAAAREDEERGERKERREHAEREEREHAEREERERPERREHAEREERERHEQREHAEREERERHEQREHAERELVELKERLQGMKREIHELSEQGKHEKAEAVEREAREIAEHLKRAHAELRERRQHAERGERDHPERALAERLNRMKREAHELREAGHHEKAEQIEREAKQMIQRFKREQAERRERAEPERRRPDDLERHRHELAERAEQIERKMHELRGAEGEEAEHHRRKLQAEMEAIRRQMRETEAHTRERAHAAERGEIERRIRHMHQAAENLAAAGREDMARHIMEEAERMERGMEPRREREEPRREMPPPEQMQRHVEELSEVVRNLHREIERLHQDMNHLRERVEER